MRLRIKPSRGEVLRMRAREALAILRLEIKACEWFLMTTNGEMAEYYAEKDLERLYEEYWRIHRALYVKGPKGKLP